METHELTAHPAYPPWAVTSVTARILSRDKNWLRLRWRIEGSGKLLVPAFAGKGRADELWHTTCFELFLKPGVGTAYCEFNLSPSSKWAAYDFSAFRELMGDAPVEAIAVACAHDERELVLQADIASELPVPASVALNAIVEDKAGNMQFWALAFADGKPEFHSETCRGLRVEARP